MRSRVLHKVQGTGRGGGSRQNIGCGGGEEIGGQCGKGECRGSDGRASQVTQGTTTTSQGGLCGLAGGDAQEILCGVGWVE